MRDVRMRGFRERTSVDDALAILAQRTSVLDTERIAPCVVLVVLHGPTAL